MSSIQLKICYLSSLRMTVRFIGVVAELKINEQLMKCLDEQDQRGKSVEW